MLCRNQQYDTEYFLFTMIFFHTPSIPGLQTSSPRSARKTAKLPLTFHLYHFDNENSVLRTDLTTRKRNNFKSLNVFTHTHTPTRGMNLWKQKFSHVPSIGSFFSQWKQLETGTFHWELRPKALEAPNFLAMASEVSGLFHRKVFLLDFSSLFSSVLHI